MNELEEYLKQDVFNPKYLFHGTAHEIEKLECRQSTDSENKDNEDNAIFLTSSFVDLSKTSSAKEIGFSNNLDNLAKTGRKESFESICPFGRPKWEHKITFAPCSVKYLIVGKVATIRVSSTILSSVLIGTL